MSELAAPLPAKMIGHLLGFPDDWWPKLVEWSSTTILLGGGPRYFNDDGILSAAEFGQASLELANERRGCPVDDLMSVWTQAEVDGCPLNDDDLSSDALLLLDGGAETTRTVIANGIDTLIRHPDQRRLLRDEPARIPVAVEELIRWTTPDPQHVPRRDPRHRDRRHTDQGGAAGRADVRVREPGRDRLRGPASLRRDS